jgi:hypothetical protein
MRGFVAAITSMTIQFDARLFRNSEELLGLIWELHGCQLSCPYRLEKY